MLVTLAAPRAWPADNPAEVMELGRIDVIGVTPLPGLGTPLTQVPSNVQVFSSRNLAGQRPRSLPDFLEQNAAGVTVNAAQGNPFQPDISYRGFTASPLLGLPQGLSVFQDGVRINEPFGDVVNWDLIPKSAIATIQLLPGANPAFGPNTLGGALAIYTKSGDQFPGGEIEAYGGSFRRRAVQFEQGGSSGSWDYFVTAHALRDDGWAEQNPSRVNQLFAKIGYQTDKTDLDVSLTAADNTLHANQTLPVSFLDQFRKPYTFPDTSVNRVGLLTLKGSRFITEDVVLGATAYWRKYRNENVSSNVANDDGVEATNDRGVIDQSSGGVGAQLTVTGKLAAFDNRLIAGASADFGSTRFTRSVQPARFTEARDTVGIGDYALDTDAAMRNGSYGVFASNALSIDERWALTVSGRYNLARIRIEDRSGEDPALDGSHRFSRLSPALGVNYNPKPGITAYAAYGQSMRAPTPIELTCADPNAPCKLPNNFLADPPLEPVISKTIEVGARGQSGETTWSGAIYRTDLSNDIQFVGGGGSAINAGFFQNVGRTRRQGAEFAVATRAGRWALSARYSYIRATFESAFSASSPANSSADATGSISVIPGNAIPGIPRQNLKLRIEYSAGDSWTVAANLLAASPTFPRGDENNRDASGRVPGYAVLNLNASWRISPGFELFALVDNVFDVRYANFGLLGENLFAGPGRTFDGAHPVNEQFRGLGTPRGAWAGVRYQWR